MSIAAVADGFQKQIFQVVHPGVSQTVAIGASSVQSNFFTSGVTIIRLFATVDCWVAMNTNPTAIAGDPASFFMPGGIVEYFQVTPNHKLAVIQTTAGSGSLYITEGANS
jgi:hypothetical protein